MTRLLLPLFVLLLSPLLASAQFGSFFDQMFQGGSSGSNSNNNGGSRRGNVPSDSAWYQRNFDDATCDKYLCPDTLACVDKPTHCPCPFPDVEEKFELDPNGLALCFSKSATKGLTARKVELARKGLL